MSNHAYCYICGNKVVAESSNSWRCDVCQQSYYENPRACAEIALFNASGEILLAKRARDPWKGKYDLPGGFMASNETAEQAMLRELAEELGLSTSDISEPVYITNWASQYPWGKETYDVINFTFAARLLTSKKILPKDDVAGIEFRNPAMIKKEEISTPQGYEAIKFVARTFPHSPFYR